MTKFLKTHGTTLTIGLFLVSTLSGVFLFFHISSATFHAMHEWLSMVLLVPVGVHIWRNWASFSGYFKKKTIVIPLVLSLAAGVAFAYPSLTSTNTGGNPMRAAIGAIQNGSIDQIAPLFNLTPDELKKRLEAKGYEVATTGAPLRAIAQKSGKGMGPGLIADIASP